MGLTDSANKPSLNWISCIREVIIMNQMKTNGFKSLSGKAPNLGDFWTSECCDSWRNIFCPFPFILWWWWLLVDWDDEEVEASFLKAAGEWEGGGSKVEVGGKGETIKAWGGVVRWPKAQEERKDWALSLFWADNWAAASTTRDGSELRAALKMFIVDDDRPLECEDDDDLDKETCNELELENCEE